MLDTLTQENTGVLDERLLLLAYGTVWFLFAFWMAIRYNLFELPEERLSCFPQIFCVI